MSFVRPVAALLLVLAAPPLVGAATFAARMPWSPAELPAGEALPAPIVAEPDPSRPLVAVLVGNHGTEATDLLPPFELLSAAGAFDVRVVAPEHRLSPLVNALLQDAGLDLVPDLGFAEWEAAGLGAPDLVVVPYLPGWKQGDGEVLEWLRDHVGPETTVLSICAGAEIVAATGLNEGRRSTGTWGWIPRLAETYPEVRWEQDAQWVADGPFVSSNSVAAGIDATLAAIGRIAGREVALATADAVGYHHPDTLDDPAARLFVEPWALLPAATPGPSRTLALRIAPGAAESAVAGHLDLWTQDLTTRVVPEGPPVHTRHGLELRPRTGDAGAAGTVLASSRADRFGLDQAIAQVALVHGDRVAAGFAGNLMYAGARDRTGPPPLHLAVPPALLSGLLAGGLWLSSRRRASWASPGVPGRTATSPA